MNASTTAPPADSNMPPVGGTYARYVLFVLVLVYMVNFIDRSILSILAEDIKRDLKLSDAEIGFLYGTAFAVFYSLFGIPLGRLADNWVRTRLLSIGLAIWSTMTALSGFSNNFVHLSAARVGVGIGEATASPSAFSMLSDWFPKERRATALAVYSSGLYIGAGVSLLIGAVVVKTWNGWYPGGGPMGLVGWQAAFLAVGFPGLLLSVWVATLKEPIRGRADGLPPPLPTPDIWKRFYHDLSSVLPPLTFFHVAQFGPRVLLTNIAIAGGFSALAAVMIAVTGDVPQWVAICLGGYAVSSWSQSLRQRDKPTFALIWGTPTFVFALVGFGLMSFVGYAAGFWAVPYAMRTFVAPMEASGLPVPFYATTGFVALALGGMGAAGGFIGVVVGGWLSDIAKRRNPGGRIIVVSLATLLPLPLFLVMFTTTSLATFLLCNIPLTILASVYPGIAAATTQDLVLPRMRGAATATYFIGTTLIGLGLGPYFAGAVSKVTGSLATGILSLLVVVPVTMVCMYFVYRRLPLAEATRVERAIAAGEPA
ncbi:MFS transporter [Polymorphobacter arshaanensis]|uniref:MFS transporter n=1 Tax=Glacieibacterium arshaanense TaxID=2511025 RepID=A0A4Y9EQA0_9SPHN|nr:MFS transporter [Polymorphobacter arshaanensis]TFU05530.1 MFS transporter [Polymorphobacter arshaanensis]